MARPQAWLAGPEGGTDERTDERTNGKSPHSTGLRPLSGPLPKKPIKFDSIIHSILTFECIIDWTKLLLRGHVSTTWDSEHPHQSPLSSIFSLPTSRVAMGLVSLSWGP